MDFFGYWVWDAESGRVSELLEEPRGVANCDLDLMDFVDFGDLMDFRDFVDFVDLERFVEQLVERL